MNKTKKLYSLVQKRKSIQKNKINKKSLKFSMNEYLNLKNTKK